MPFRLRAVSLIAFAALTAQTLRSQSPLDLEQGRRLYETHCVSCHGPRGEGGKGPTLAQPALPRAGDDESLARIIRRGIGGTEMPGTRLETHEVVLLAGFVKSLGSLPPVTVPGNAERGARLYATKGACAQCHMLHGQGGVIGPDLGDIGLRRSPSYLRRSLVEPSAEVPQSYSAFRSDISLPLNFLFVRIVTRNGDALEGVRVNEDTFSIQIRDLDGRVHSYFKSDLAEFHKDWGRSPMPAYTEGYSEEELDDLVAFLVSLRDPQ